MVLNKEKILSIVDKVKEGMTNKEIAEEFGMSVKTIIKWKNRLRESGHEMPPKSIGGRPRIEL